jgi:hypothetical protein
MVRSAIILPSRMTSTRVASPSTASASRGATRMARPWSASSDASKTLIEQQHAAGTERSRRHSEPFGSVSIQGGNAPGGLTTHRHQRERGLDPHGLRAARAPALGGDVVQPLDGGQLRRSAESRTDVPNAMPSRPAMRDDAVDLHRTAVGPAHTRDDP